jgi:DNA-binding protein HU-beta
MAVVTRDGLARDLKAWVEKEGGEMPMSSAREEINWVFDRIASSLKTGNDVRVTGFGTFRLVHRKARVARNPQTGAPVNVPARKVLRWTPATTLKAAVGASRRKTTARKTTAKPTARTTTKKTTARKR